MCDSGLPCYPANSTVEALNTTDTSSGNQRRFPSKLQEIVSSLLQECYIRHQIQPPLLEDGPYCNRTMDVFGGCWPDTLPGKRAIIHCPDIPNFNPQMYAYRDCNPDSTWYVSNSTGNIWANYSACFKDVPDGAKYVYIYIGGLSFSILLLVISLAIFFRFRQLRCDRITIHKHLFLSYVFTGLTWFFYYVFAALDGDVIFKNPVWCQVLHVICHYFMTCNFLWMFCEGLYLNTIMVCAFTSGKALILCCYGLGWGVPIVFTIIYAVIRANDSTAAVDCWLQETNYVWIMYGPIVLTIGVNLIFLINIVRLLVTKLRQMPEANQTKKATRATLILVPLLGLHYILLPIRPEPGTSLDDLYHIAAALLMSLQGAFVSIIYCFCNGEVIQVIRRKWNQHRLMHTSSMRASANHGTTYTSIDHTMHTNTYLTAADNKEGGMEMTPMGNT